MHLKCKILVTRVNCTQYFPSSSLFSFNTFALPAFAQFFRRANSSLSFRSFFNKSQKNSANFPQICIDGSEIMSTQSISEFEHHILLVGVFLRRHSSVRKQFCGSQLILWV